MITLLPGEDRSTMLLLRNRVAADGLDGSPSYLCRRIVALAAGRLLYIMLAQQRGKMVCIYIYI